jgi:hypothetical protein
MIVAQRYACKFGNGAGGHHVITVDLTDTEVECARAHPHPNIAAMAAALRRAYRLAPEGFTHIASGVTPMWAN